MITSSTVSSHNNQQSKYATHRTYLVVSYFQVNKAISDLKIATKTLKWVPPLLKMCTDPLTENNNRNFQEVPPLSFLCPLGRHNLSVFQ